MPDIYTLEKSIKELIDELKGLCSQTGLGNQAAEEVVITSVFLYKFLNDKFMYNLHQFADDMGMTVEEVLKNENDEMDAFYDTYSRDVAFTYDETIESLVNHIAEDDFYKTFDDTLERISNDPRNEAFSIDTAEGEKRPLFTRITENVESSSRNNFARSIFSYITEEKFDFKDAFHENFDFYSTIFEYLIKDYNVASGIYAEYFTPQAVSSIIGTILANMSPLEDKIYEVYDPSAGSGSLVLHLANALGKGSFGNKAQVYTQDISQKSSRFLRINMLLNGLTESLDNIIQGDTLLTPAHYNVPHEPSSGVKQFDFITSNPPFKMDFSSTSQTIATKWEQSEERDGYRRFFAGIPKIPNKKKDSMAIYLCFIQHILWSIKSDGKAAVVVPTGFLTAKSGIELAIRTALIKNHWLKGVVSMPSNIFANTGTNVSVLFIDKANTEDKVILMDASKLGTKVKEGKNQRTVLSDDEVKKIENTFINREEIDDFSVLVSFDDIKEKGYSFSAGQYFEVKIEYVDISQEEFERRVNEYKVSLEEKFQKGHEFEQSILEQLGGLKL